MKNARERKKKEKKKERRLPSSFLVSEIIVLLTSEHALKFQYPSKEENLLKKREIFLKKDSYSRRKLYAQKSKDIVLVVVCCLFNKVST